MAVFGDSRDFYGTANTSNAWISTTSATTYPLYLPPQTDWQRAEVKAEPDDEFSWLRKRVREVEEMAFA